MHQKATVVQLLWHVAGAINAIREVIFRASTSDYPGAIQYAIKAAGHLSALGANQETLKQTGATLVKRIKQIMSKVSYHLRQRRKHIDRNDEEE